MIRGHTIGSRGDLVKYLALVAACLLTVALGAPATADDPDPVQVTFPDVTELNPAHTPYVLDIQDPAPERGELVAAWGDHRMTLPHEGTATVPLTAADGPSVTVVVVRCPADGGSCAWVVPGRTITLVTALDLEPTDSQKPLGSTSGVPVRLAGPGLDAGQVVSLTWTVTDSATATVIASGSADWVLGVATPGLGIPVGSSTTSADVAVSAVAETDRFGHLEGTTDIDRQVDARPPVMTVDVDSSVIFPFPDEYLDTIAVRVTRATDLHDTVMEVVDQDGVETTFHTGRTEVGHRFLFYGRSGHRLMHAGRYTMRITGHDEAGNSTVVESAFRIDDRRRVKKTYRATVPAARTLADKYVGACSHLGSAAGRGWKGSIGLYSTTPCAKRNGSVVITVHGGWLPPSVGGYPGRIQLSLYGGGARGTRSAYVVHGWLGAAHDEFLGRSQLDGNVGVHTVSEVAPRDVVRTYKRQHWVYWQLGLTDGSRYDVKSFTITTPYYVLIPSTSRTANDAKTMAEPSGAPGPGYTVPKTDAAEFPAAYRPAR